MRFVFFVSILGDAPNTGNMEVLASFGNEAQKAEWLTPLMNGTIRSCFGMTEPDVASSDATNIECSIVKDGDSYVINGRKHWTSGFQDPRTKLCILMGRTGRIDAPRHLQQSMILVPTDAPGVTLVRPLKVFGYDDSPHGHAEVAFVNVRVPVTNMILGEGRGFEIAQGRLGPGRIHRQITHIYIHTSTLGAWSITLSSLNYLFLVIFHFVSFLLFFVFILFILDCMRLIGMAERALETMIQRTMTRTAFGGLLAHKGTILKDIADSRIEIDSCRLLCLQAASMMDTVGNKLAAQQIGMIKVMAPAMCLRVLDRAIQAHGGKGVSQDTILPWLYAGARTLRLAGTHTQPRLNIYNTHISTFSSPHVTDCCTAVSLLFVVCVLDGPDEVHRENIAKLELIKAKL